MESCVKAGVSEVTVKKMAFSLFRRIHKKSRIYYNFLWVYSTLMGGCTCRLPKIRAAFPNILNEEAQNSTRFEKLLGNHLDFYFYFYFFKKRVKFKTFHLEILIITFD
jgi:hypothetical protein